MNFADLDEDGLADVVKNYGHHIKTEWREDGSIIASTHMDTTLKRLVDTNGDSVADFRCYDKNFNGIWDFEENK